MGFMPCDMGSLLSFAGMVGVMLAEVSYMEVTKIALSRGINKYVIIVYSDALATLILLPCSFIVHRSDSTPLNFSLLCDLFLVSVFGCSSQIFQYVGLEYSSLTLGTAMLNLIPAFTFMLAIIFRLEKLDWRSKSSIAKSIGTTVSIAGAFVVTFYKGPALFGIPSHIIQPHQLLHSPQLFWMLGAFFFAADALMNSASYILQTFIVKKFPAVLIIVCYLCFFATVLSAIFALVVVKDPSSWKIKPDIGLVAILYTAIIGLAFRVSLSFWCLSRTGPLYVAMFKPLAIVFAVLMDAIFLGHTLSLGSLIGGIVIVTGFYTVLWGKAKEEKTSMDNAVGSFETSSNRVPLLHTKIEEI